MIVVKIVLQVISFYTIEVVNRTAIGYLLSIYECKVEINSARTSKKV